MDPPAEESEPSEAGGSSSGDPSAPTVPIADLVRRLQARLVSPKAELSLSSHQAAARTLARLRSRLATRAEPVSPATRFALLCVGIHMHRRAEGSLPQDDRLDPTEAVAGAAASAEEEQLESEDTLLVQRLLRRTAACLLVVCCMAEWDVFDAEDDERENAAARSIAEARETATLAAVLLPPPSRKRSGTDAEREESERRLAAWKAALDAQPRPERVARAMLRAAALVAAGEDAEAGAEAAAAEAPWRRLDALAPVFFRASADAMAYRLLLPDGDADFVSLDAARIARDSDEERAKKLRSIAQAAESEAGQGVARALMMSFLLPAAIVGTRRSLLLSREANTRATLDFPQEVERAHNVAIAGTEWIFDKGEDDLERGVSVLAGLAMLTTQGREDAIRKGAACGGRLQLPFFETPPPAAPAALRLTLVPHLRRWVLYRLDRKGKPVVVSSQRGFEGLCTAALLLVSSMSSRAA